MFMHGSTMKVRLRHLCHWTISLIALGGCSQPQEVVVARVGDHVIGASSLRNLVGDLSPEDVTASTGDQARRHYLQVLVDGRLFLLEAHDRGIDTTRAVDEAVRQTVRDRVRKLYLEREVGPGLPVTEADVRQVVAREGFDKERRLNRILAPDREAIDRITTALEAGQTFEEVAAAQPPDDDMILLEREESGFLGPPLLARMQIPQDLFRSLTDGEVSRPIPMEGGAWQILRFTETVSVDFSNFISPIETRLKHERRLQALKEHREALASADNARLNRPGLNELIEAYEKLQTDAVATSSSALYHLDGGVVTVGEAHHALAASGLRRSFVDSSEAEIAVRHLVLYPRLLERAAAAAGLYDLPEIHRLRKQHRDQVLAASVRDNALAEVEVTEEEERRYYESNPHQFRVEGHALVEELLLPSESSATRIRDRIAAGEKFVSLIEHTTRPEARRHQARYHFHPHEHEEYPELMAAVDAATVGALQGPVAVNGGYSVFRVLERVPEGVQPFARARSRARALVLKSRHEEAFEQLVIRLREKFKSDVVVYEKKLTRALPDSLLQKARGV